MEIVPFGKYKGKPVEVLEHDKQYTDWLTKQDWFRDRYPTINQVIINNFGEPSRTPEHNALQAKFTDESFQKAFVAYLTRKFNIDFEIQSIEFEGIMDIAMLIKSKCKRRMYTVGIEIKPNLGDDYPEILRQMKNAYTIVRKEKNTYDVKVLIYQSFTAVGANIEQVKTMFKPYVVYSFADIKGYEGGDENGRI